MIQNDRELAITQEAARNFEKALERLHKDPAHLSLSPVKQEIYRRAYEGEVHTLNNQIREYQKKQEALPKITA